VAPTLALVLMALLPYALPQTKNHELGKWFPRGNRISQIVIVVLTFAIIILTILSVLQTPST
jgi:hypothetical protein